MTAKEILTQLQLLGSEAIRNVYKNHGAPVTHYGVKVEDMKKIQKKIKKDHKLSLQLFDSGIPDAQYLAGLVRDVADTASLYQLIPLCKRHAPACRKGGGFRMRCLQADQLGRSKRVRSDRRLKPKKNIGKGITGMLIGKRFSRCVKEITFFYKHPFFSYKHSCT